MKQSKWIAIAIVVALVAVLVWAWSGTGRPATGAKEAPNTVAVISIEGVISAGGGEGGLLGITVQGNPVLKQLRQAQEDKSLKAVVLRINSPGGSAAAAQEIGREVDKLRRSGKYVVTSMSDVAASGGYWIAALTDKIVANPATLTGSIGVIMETANLSDLYQKLGVKMNVIKSGPHKDMGSSSRPLTPAEQAIFQSMVDDIYDQFVDVVVNGRKLPREKVLALADGRVFTGRQALKLGLVDEMGGFEEAVLLAARAAGIKGRPAIRTYEEPSPFEFLLGRASATLPAWLKAGEFIAVGERLISTRLVKLDWNR